jgi:peptidoglycan/xylan/chitin deacetylase (PgdA/CDA1 family)
MDKRNILNIVDRTASNIHLKMFGEQPGLSAFLLHGMFRNSDEINKNHILPQERMTVDHFRKFLDYFLSHNYKFVSPDEIRKNGVSDTTARYALLSFDDGYFNNLMVPEILAEYKVPAVFFFSSAYILEGKKFWSDVIYHIRKKQGRDDLSILHEIIALKNRKTAEVEAQLIKEHGSGCLKPLGDIDRPMTPSEFISFSQMPFIHLGNHTHQHEILTNLSDAETDLELKTSQQQMLSLTGKTPWFISYPNGSFSERTIQVAIQNGLTMGITTIQQKNQLPLIAGSGGQVLLHRFNPSVSAEGRDNYSTLRSSLQLKTKLKKWLQ